MRTIILSAIAAVAAGALLAGPASAENAPWQCMSPAFACGGAPAKTYRDRDGYAGERTYRRQATSKRSRDRVAKTDKVEVKKQKVARAEAAEKPQAKIELPERKQAADKPATVENSKTPNPRSFGGFAPARDCPSTRCSDSTAASSAA